MSEFEEKLNSILNDPEQLGKITQMAKSLMDGGEKSPPEVEEPPLPQGIFPDFGLDMNLLAKVGKMMSGAGNDGNSQHRALLEAMTPYLAEKRRRRMEQALKMAKMAKLAKLAFAEFGGDGGE